MVSVPEEIALALERLVKRLEETTIEWALTGSTSFVLQGVPMEPTDIDVQTTASGAYAIEELFSGHVTDPVTFTESATIRSHFGTVVLDGVTVEIMGALQKRLDDGTWEPPVDVSMHRTRVAFRGHDVPVLSLAYEAEAYDQLGRTERADELRQYREET